MSNIEDDIKNIKELIQASKVFEQYEGNKYYKSMENILAEYEQDKKRIKELEEENANLKIKNNSRTIGHYAEVKLEEILKEDYIPKPKVKDKIEEIKEDKEKK